MIILTCFLNQIFTKYFESSVAPVIKISSELNTDFECPYSRLEICHKSQFVEQKAENYKKQCIVKFHQNLKKK